jgi:uncharacterized protein (DUF1786 family)
MGDPIHPVDGTAFMLAASRASVPPSRLSDLLADAQVALAERRETYRRRYERPLETPAFEAFLVDEGHWAELGEEFGWRRRDHEAVARAHRQKLLQAGKDTDRRREFENALDLREAVVVGKD